MSNVNYTVKVCGEGDEADENGGQEGGHKLAENSSAKMDSDLEEETEFFFNYLHMLLFVERKKSFAQNRFGMCLVLPLLNGLTVWVHGGIIGDGDAIDGIVKF